MLAFTGVHTISHVINVRVIEVKGVRIMHDGNTAMELLWMHPAALTGVVMLFCMVCFALKKDNLLYSHVPSFALSSNVTAPYRPFRS